MSTSSTDNGGFRVTLRDVYDIVKDLADRVLPLPGKVEEHQKTLDDHENRLRTVEGTVQRWTGGRQVATIAASLVTSGAVAAIVTHIK